jgi:hypothetical protein
MKKLLVLLAILLIPTFIQARSLKEITLKVEPVVYCTSKKIAAWGCFSSATQTITIKSGLTPLRRTLVLLHELGHFFTQDVSYEEYREVFGEGTKRELEEEAADKFIYFVRHPNVLSEKEMEFYISLF